MKWISIKNVIPPDNTRLLFYNRNLEKVLIGSIEYGDDGPWDNMIYIDGKDSDKLKRSFCSHWMPIPDLPDDSMDMEKIIIDAKEQLNQ